MNQNCLIGLFTRLELFFHLKFLTIQVLSDQAHKLSPIPRYLAASLDRDKIRPQDATSVVSGVAHNLAGAHLAWRHLQMNWAKLVEKFGDGSFTMGNLIESTISHFSTEFDLNEVQSFFRSLQVGSGQRALAQSLEQIRINIQWRRDHQQQIRNFIDSKVLSEKEMEVPL